MAIEVENVSKWYGNQKALDEISFSVSKGEIVGFLGPNGAGKTTTMKIITCFMPPTSGTVKVTGIDTRDKPNVVQQQIGYLPEHNPLYKEMYVREYLGFVCRVHFQKNIIKRIEEIIDITGLRSHANKKIHELSKGYRQRVGLAQALLHDPAVLILDEPTTGLDPNQIVEIRNIIRDQGKEKTVLLSTHILQEVEALCDRIIIINKGKIVVDSPTVELQQQMRAEESLVVQFDKPISSRELTRIKELGHIQDLSDQRWKLLGKGKDVRPELFDFAVANDLRILELYKEASTLEDIFRELTV